MAMNNVFFIHFPLPFSKTEEEKELSSNKNDETIFAFLFDEGDYLSLLDLQNQDFYIQTKDDNERHFANHEWSEIPFLAPFGASTLGYRIFGLNMENPLDRARALELMEIWQQMFFKAGLQVSPIMPLKEGVVKEGIDVPKDSSPWDKKEETQDQEKQDQEEISPLSIYEQAQIKYQDLDL